ncbi:MAG: hypothetical protein AAF849_17545 [Bacteroidota bacterium]
MKTIPFYSTFTIFFFSAVLVQDVAVLDHTIHPTRITSTTSKQQLEIKEAAFIPLVNRYALFSDEITKAIRYLKILLTYSLMV